MLLEYASICNCAHAGWVVASVTIIIVWQQDLFVVVANCCQCLATVYCTSIQAYSSHSESCYIIYYDGLGPESDILLSSHVALFKASSLYRGTR